MTILELKTHLTGQLHGGTLNKVRNIEYIFKRAANNVLKEVKPVETERTAPLAQVIHDDLNNYPLPTDFLYPIDLYPQDRNNSDTAKSVYSERFDLKKGIENKTVSIEGSEGSKYLRINWKSESPMNFHAMNSLTENGTVAIVATASGLKINELYKLSGSGSVEFDVNATGDGIQITGASQVNLNEWDELADIIFPIYIPVITNLTSVTAIWGNDLTANYWTGVAQTAQADGTAFRTGWNWIKVPWSTATESGTVDPTAIDSFKITIQSAGAISNIRVDNIEFSLGRTFDIKYYSKYLFKNSAGTLITQPTTDNDSVILDDDLINAFINECLIMCAQQIQGEDASFDIDYARKELYGNPNSPDVISRNGIYATYRLKHPDQSKKIVSQWSPLPRFNR